MIPKIIWQTYEDDYIDLPHYIKETSNTWIEKNPDYEIKYFNAKQREEFILDKFGIDWIKRYNKSVSGSMKADIWKFLIIYYYGGVYSDMDYTCEKPISYWIKNDMDMIIASDETEDEITCAVFASVKNHPALKSIIDTVYNNLTKIDFSIESIPYTLTGPIAFTKGIKNFLNIKNKLDLYNNVEEINQNSIAIQNKLYCYGNESFKMFNGLAVKHLNGRVNWYEGKYDWVKQEQERYKKYLNDIKN